MPDEIAMAGQEVVDMLGACAAAPDDLETGRAADEALLRLEQALAATPVPVAVPDSRELLEELRRICAETADIPLGRITAEADLADDLGVDSLSHEELVVKALGRYDLSTMANTVQAASYPTLQAIVELIQQLTVPTPEHSG